MAINTNILKAYAPEARRAFIAAVKARAARFGITEEGSSPIREEGNVAIINGQPYPRSFAQQRRDLDKKIELRGYSSVMEEVAYTWFNRFAAIRYMELHDYLDHGVRVLSHPNGGSTPEIVEKAAQVDLPGLKRDQVVALKLDGTKDEELYRLLIVAQCNALHAVMPFLFEKIEDETELLLPDNLLHSGSLVRQLVDRVPETDWQHIEIIGWLYQFYISERKADVIGEVVAPADIPAATQLFTPNWIVKYMVQNSLGAKWLAAYPGAPLRAKMEYYVEPCDGDAQVEDLTPEPLNPETITFLDPASGSGHILVEAYNLFREIYLERGYRPREFPRLILEKNLFGVDIDDRAAQLSGFALLMRARADDRHLFSGQAAVQLNVLAIQDSRGIDASKIADALLSDTRFDLLSGGDLLPETVAQPILSVDEVSHIGTDAILGIIRLFEGAKTVGSVVSIPQGIARALPDLRRALISQDVRDLVDRAARVHAAATMAPFVHQAGLLSRSYDVVVANPPYMGSGYFSRELKSQLTALGYNTKRTDLYAIFMERIFSLAHEHGHIAMVTRQDWLHTSSYELLRSKVLMERCLQSLVQLGPDAFEGITGEVVQAATFSLRNNPLPGYECVFIDARSGSGVEKSHNLRSPEKRFCRSAGDFPQRLGRPLLYSLSSAVLHAFDQNPPIDDFSTLREGIHTGKNGRYVRVWWEVSGDRCERQSASLEEFDRSGARWAPYNKGGTTAAWYRDSDFVIAFDEKSRAEMAELSGHVRPSQSLYFREGGTWSDVATTGFGVRFFPDGYLFDGAGPVVVSTNIFHDLALMNSKPFREMARIAMPNLHFKCGTLKKLPFVRHSDAERIGRSLVAHFRDDASTIETQSIFERPHILREPAIDLSVAYNGATEKWKDSTSSVKSLLEENNVAFCEAFGLSMELSPSEDPEDISLSFNPEYRYGSAKSHEDQRVLLLEDTVRDLLSYSVGCLFGRYSLDVPGLVLANQGETLQDYLVRVPTPSFMPDADNVIPVMDDPWFSDDVSDRFLEFLRTAFGEEKYVENLAFVEAALGKDVRKFFKRDFYADHLRRYKKRPIYWLFSSGKERAFEALVYLHRYNESTLARMRLEYVVPLQSQMAGRIQRLTDEVRAGNLSSSETKKRNVQVEKLQKQQDELRRFEEELHHFADQRIQLDLDDGVKVNYGKFGNLLADVKAITGGKDDE
jgi:hypothetical protein